jgi:hypothetical protein
MTQYFKGDETEIKMHDAAAPAFDLCDAALEAFYSGAYTANDFLLSLYDQGRMPFSARVPRAAFVDFYKQALVNFPVTGTFEAYIFIIRSIFGETTEIQFEVPAAGKLNILVDAAASTEFGWQVKEYSGGEYVYSDMVTLDDQELQFRGISGIENEAQLNALLSELIPAGIFPTVTFQVFDISNFVDFDGESILDYLDNEIVFFETGA